MREFVRLQTGTLLKSLAHEVKHTSQGGTADAIHDLRVAIRRLRRCLQVFAQFYGGTSWKELRKHLEEVMDACGDVRDRDIAIELLEKAEVPAGSPLVRHLNKERRSAELVLRRKLRPWNAPGCWRQWRVRLEI